MPGSSGWNTASDHRRPGPVLQADRVLITLALQYHAAGSILDDPEVDVEFSSGQSRDPPPQRRGPGPALVGEDGERGQALAQGEETVVVWRAVCAAYPDRVPAQLR